MVNENRRCGMCSKPIPAHKVQFARRVEQMEVVEKDGKQFKSMNVFANDVFMEFCSHTCWAGRELEVIAAYELKATYPAFQWVASCSRCGAPVNRTKPYVTLNIYEAIDESKPWVNVERMLDDKELAVLCPMCDAPAEAKSEQIVNELADLEPNQTT